MVERIGYAGAISEPLRLCRPWRSAARLQACFRRSIGGFHGQATDRLINVRSGLEAVIALPRNLIGLTLGTRRIVGWAMSERIGAKIGLRCVANGVLASPAGAWTADALG